METSCVATSLLTSSLSAGPAVRPSSSQQVEIVSSTGVLPVKARAAFALFVLLLAASIWWKHSITTYWKHSDHVNYQVVILSTQQLGLSSSSRPLAWLMPLSG